VPQYDVSRILRETFVRDVDYSPVVDSTNNLAAEWAKSGKAKMPLLVLADRQTAGRGRGTNRWWTGQGSLACSLLVDDPFLPPSSSDFPLLGLATGIAVVDAVQRFLPGHRVGLLWPNDISVADRKLGGILIEVAGRNYAILGIGANVNNSIGDAPVELRSSAVSLFDLTGVQVDLTELLIGILSQLEINLGTLRDSSFSKILAEIYCQQDDRQISILTIEGTLAGVCRGVAADEKLILETSEGLWFIDSWKIIRYRVADS
jgi:BirA family biotin operon repressor/biotin-[acetyl-CoA-carboxylase] ligase